MIKAKRKPIDELLDSINACRRVLIVGCGGCVSVCYAGGQQEAGELTAQLEYRAKKDPAIDSISAYTVERQCNARFLSGLDDLSDHTDGILSMACGAGVQFLADRYPDIPVFPAVNTVFIGVDRAPGWYEEKCRACGECVLAYSGGICPVTRCAKSLFNGPCGGTDDGDCEVAKGIPCAWFDIYNRLEKQGRLADIFKIRPPMQWHNQIQRSLIQRGFENRYNIKD